MKRCSIAGCTKRTGIKGTAKGLCSMHYSRLVRYGDPRIPRKRPRITHLPCTVAD